MGIRKEKKEEQEEQKEQEIEEIETKAFSFAVAETKAEQVSQPQPQSMIGACSCVLRAPPFVHESSEWLRLLRCKLAKVG